MINGRGVRRLAAFLTAAFMVCIVSACATDPAATTPKRGASGTSPSASSDGCARTRLLPANTHVAIDYLDFVRLYGFMYLSENGSINRHRVHPPLGNRVGVVRCTLEKLTNDGHHEPAGRLRDGTAAFLPRGTVLYSVLGYSRRCRLAAFWQSRRVDYFALRKSADHSAPRRCALH